MKAQPGSTLVALDLDGTIEDSRADMVAAVHRVRQRRSLVPRPGDDFLPHINRGMAHLYRHCFADALDAGHALDEIAADYEAAYLAHIADTTELYPGMVGVLAELSELASLAVVTNKGERLSRALLDALGVLGHFAAVVGGDTCAEAKPSPLPLAFAATSCAVDPVGGRVFMIGDSAGDIRTGRALGATVIWCAWGYYDAPSQQAPDFTAYDPADLPRLVREALAAAGPATAKGGT